MFAFRSRPTTWKTISIRARWKHIIYGTEYLRDSHTNVTASILSLLQRQLHLQAGHPLSILRNRIEAYFGPSFTPITNLSPIVTPAQNFDSLSFPPDHPGRALSDSYYLNKDWMLRTHTSAHEVEAFQFPSKDKWLLTADVYRRDEIDRSHYPVFHQMEGARLFSSADISSSLPSENEEMLSRLSKSNIIITDSSNISPQNPCQLSHDPVHALQVKENLQHRLNSLLLDLFSGIHSQNSEPLQVRWIDAYFPFTSPSFEVEVFFNGKWLEILGCGVVQQATLDRAGVNDRMGWAFGLGLERIAMVLFQVPDIRLFWTNDRRFLDQFSEGNITIFTPYSRFPVCWKDISFWTSSEALGPKRPFHENDLCDIIRDEAGDLVEEINLVDQFKHPKTGRESLAYRVNYRAMDRSLANEEVNAIHQKIRQRLGMELGVAVR